MSIENIKTVLITTLIAIILVGGAYYTRDNKETETQEEEHVMGSTDWNSWLDGVGIGYKLQTGVITKEEASSLLPGAGSDLSLGEMKRGYDAGIMLACTEGHITDKCDHKGLEADYSFRNLDVSQHDFIDSDFDPTNPDDCIGLVHRRFDFNKELNACLMQTSVSYPDHGGYAQSATVVNLATDETLLKWSSDATYFSEGSMYYVDPKTRNIIIDNEVFNALAEKLSPLFGCISFGHYDYGT